MGFLSNIFKKKEAVKEIFVGEDSGAYISSDGKLGILTAGGDREARVRAAGLLREEIGELTEEDPKGGIRAGMERTNRRLNELGDEISAIVFYQLEKHTVIAHIGLIRGYIVRDDELIQLTEDDTQGWVLFKGGMMDEERLRESPLGRMTVRALGKGKICQVSTTDYYFSPGEKLVLIDGAEAMNYGDEKLYDILGGRNEEPLKDFSGGGYLIKGF